MTDWDGYDTCYTERYMGTPQNNPEGYKASSVLTHAATLAGRPARDPRACSTRTSTSATRPGWPTALIAAGKPFELLPIPAERHSSRKVPERTYIAERMANFFYSTLAD